MRLLTITRPTKAATGDAGTALVFVPVLVLMTVSLVVLLVDLAGMTIRQGQLQEIAQACAIQGARAISPSAFYGSGAIAIDLGTATTQVDQCVASDPLRTRFGTLTIDVTSQGSILDVAITTRSPITFGSTLLPGLNSVALNASAGASEE